MSWAASLNMLCLWWGLSSSWLMDAETWPEEIMFSTFFSGNCPSHVSWWGDLSEALEADAVARFSCQHQAEEHIKDKAQVNESNVLTED